MTILALFYPPDSCYISGLSEIYCCEYCGTQYLTGGPGHFDEKKNLVLEFS